MKIFVVDDQEEPAAVLAAYLRERGAGETIAIAGGNKALEEAKSGGAPDVLVTEVVLEGVNGFELRHALLGMRPDLRTIYVTGYDLSAYAEYIDGVPVFYKPADAGQVLAALGAGMPASEPRKNSSQITGQSSQSARLRNLVEKQGFTGKLDQFSLVDIIQLCCIGKRSGRLQISRGVERGVLFLEAGKIIHAVSGALEGAEAVYEIVGWSAGQFVFEDGVQPDVATISTGWEHLVMEGVRRRDEKAVAEAAARPPEDQDPALAGKTIGPYLLRRKIGHGQHTQVFEAMQTSMERVVALKVLLPEYEQDHAAVEEFVVHASVKANVQHPSILSVYEAGESNGVHFYAREFVDGTNLAGLQAQGRTMDDATALQCIKVAAEAIGYLNLQKIPHPPLTSEDIYVGRDGRARLNNIASLPAGEATSSSADIHSLSRAITACLGDQAAASPGVKALLGRMLIEGAGGFQSWGALLQVVRALEPRVVPQDAFKLSQQDVAAIAAVNDAKRRQKRALVWTTVGMFLVIWLIAAVCYFKFFRVAGAKTFDLMVLIPAGEFIYQNNEKVTLPDFWIDQYEVTAAQYAAFLSALKAHPTTEYDSPDQPAGRLHGTNLSWIKFYEAATSGGTYNGASVNLNCPAVFLDWFDAFAYAKWKGHRLPTEQEWEKAARGTDGRHFPWGSDASKIALVNTSADYHENGAVKGTVDGYNHWSPVDVMTGDRSPYGVMDMAGNVSEWTSTLIPHGLVQYPIVRGGNFGSQDVDITRRVTSVTVYDAKDRIGFRTVSDKAPHAK